MATVPSPRTWEQTELVNATMLNSQIRDAIRFFFADGIRPFTIAMRTTSDSLAHNDLRAVTWTDTLVDDDNMWAGSEPTLITINTPGLYDLRAQYFALGNTTNGNNGVRALTLIRYIGGEGEPVVLSRGGAAASWCEPDSVPAFGDPVSSQPMDTVCRTQVYQALNAGDQLAMQVYQNSGSTISIVHGGTTGLQTYFSARWIAAS